MRLSRLLVPVALGLVLAAPWAQAQRAPDAAAQKSAIAPHAMVAAANPLAVQVGVKVLKAGGSAVDAAVAIQAVLGLLEPQSSGLGGGAFMLHYDAAHHRITAYDGREVAPAGATADMFMGPNAKPLSFGQAVVSGRATGVPGAIAMLYMAQKDHGRLAWKDLFGDATALADDGFVVSPRLANFLTLRFPQSTQPDVVRYFTKPDGTLYKAGDVLKNPAYAATLRRLAAEGPDALLKGSIAADIVARTHAEPLPGTLTPQDLAGYRPKKTEAVCRPYHAYAVCTPQLPSGGPALLELLGLLEHSDIARYGPKDARGWYIFAEASRLMYADRDQYMGDPAFVTVPQAGLLDPAYLKARAGRIGDMAEKTVTPGQPMGAVAMGHDRTVEPGGTSNFAIVDDHGDVVVMTTTVESVFGTGRMVDGFFINNQLTDFSFSPTNTDGTPAANAVAPGKRPRSSMTPTLILDREGRFYAAIGSPGGSSILDYVGKTVMGMVEWKMPMPEAIALPNLVGRGDVVGTEDGLDPAIVAGLQARGLTVSANRGENSGLHGAVKVKGGYLGAADPRREGIAVGF